MKCGLGSTAFECKALSCTGENCMAQATALGCVVVWPLSALNHLFYLRSQLRRWREIERTLRGKTHTKPPAHTHSHLSHITSPLVQRFCFGLFHVAWQSVEYVQQLSTSHCKKIDPRYVECFFGSRFVYPITSESLNKDVSPHCG